MNWKNIENGYEFQIHVKHGQHTSEVVEVIRCSLEESDFDKHVKILQYLVESVERNFEKCTEDVAKFIEKKTEISENEIMSIIDNVVTTDIKWDDQMAHPKYIEVFRYEDGKVQKTTLN